jgi:hypothetical protein
MNLSGMGVGARRMQLEKDGPSIVPPGYFWCEYFNGLHTTVDYEWTFLSGRNNDQPILTPVFAANGYRISDKLYRFSAWKKISPPEFTLPKWINEFSDVPRVNIEFIHDKIIEIHLRSGVDFPPDATEIIPRWADMSDSDCEILHV